MPSEPDFRVSIENLFFVHDAPTDETIFIFSALLVNRGAPCPRFPGVVSIRRRCVLPDRKMAEEFGVGSGPPSPGEKSPLREPSEKSHFSVSSRWRPVARAVLAERLLQKAYGGMPCKALIACMG
jgi:hypothetical protein